MICVACQSDHNGRFCSTCGEDSQRNRITLGSTISSFVSSITSMDKGILFNLKHLTLEPSATIQNYLKGARKNIFNPISYAFLMVTIHVLLDNYFSSNSSLNEKKLDEVFYEFGYNFGGFIKGKLKYFWLINIFLLALFTRLFFKKYNYYEHLAISAFVIGHATLIGAIGTPFKMSLIFNPIVTAVTWILLFFIFKVPDKKFETGTKVGFSLLLTILLFYIVGFFLYFIFQ